jgi:polyisoprenoid-binding protein YceI
MRKLIASVSLGLMLVSVVKAETFNVDPVHSSVLYCAGHMGISNSWGRFDDVSGKISLDDKDPKANAIDFTIKPASINSGDPKRDEHLRSVDFFNAKQFPAITFKSDSVKQVDAKTYEATGTLTLHGVSKPITLKIEKVGAGQHPMIGTAIGLESAFTIKRSDFDMKNMLEAIPDNVKLLVSIEASHR